MNSSSNSAASANSVQVDLLLETGGGGAGRHVIDLYRGLRQLGWNAHLILSSRRADRTFAAEVAEIPRDHVTYLDLRRYPHPADFAAIAHLRRYISGSSVPHLVHAHSTKAGLIGSALRKVATGTVLTAHAYRGMDPTLNRFATHAIRRVESAFSRSFDRLIAVSPDEEGYISSLGVPMNRVHYIPNGVDVGNIRARIAGANPSERRDKQPVIGFVGRLVHQKNPMLFLDAFRSVIRRGIDARALVVGDGPMKAALMETAAKYSVSHLIEWRGNVPAVEELARINVAVHTSLYESCPYTLIEAVAALVPIVAVENSGSRAILGDLWPPSIVGKATAERLADAMVEFLDDGPTRRNHLKALEAVSRRFTIQKMLSSTVSVYEEVLREPRNAGLPASRHHAPARKDCLEGDRRPTTSRLGLFTASSEQHHTADTDPSAIEPNGSRV